MHGEQTVSAEGARPPNVSHTHARHAYVAMAPPVPMEETLRTMATIFGGLYGTLLVAAQVLRRPGGKPKGTWLPPATAAHASKRAGELFCLYYSPLWILAVGA